MRVHVDRARDVARVALDHGGSFSSGTTVTWDVATKCERPYMVTLEGRPVRAAVPTLGISAKTGRTYQADRHAACDRFTRPGTKGEHPLWVDMKVGCRQCAACLRKRAFHWRERAMLELNAANRTWFGTLTLSPHEHWLSQCRAGVEFSGLTDAEQFAERHRANGVLLTNYVKRIRKHAGAGLRFLCVAEAHKSGLPHYHVLVHEPHGLQVRHAELSGQWTHGFSRWKLVRDLHRSASYVTKYLTKSSLARVRASVGYGNIETALSHSPSGREKPNTQKSPQTEEERRPRTERDGVTGAEASAQHMDRTQE